MACYSYYSDWGNESTTCKHCGWKGILKLAGKEYFNDCFELLCPSCAETMGVVGYPTIEESEANWDKLDNLERLEVLARKQFLDDWAASKLKDESQLPDIESDSITLLWDQEEIDKKEWTVLRYGNQEVFRELACYEGFMRFKEVVEILKKKYDPRLHDVVPSKKSMLYLYGDRLHSLDYVESVRKGITEPHDVH